MLIGFPAAIPECATVLPRFLQAEDAACHPFSIVFRSAQASPAPETAEIAAPKPPSVRKAIVPPKQPPNSQGARAGNQVVPVQTVLGQQPQPMFLSISLSLESAADQGTNGDSISGGVAGDAGNPEAQGSTDAPPQLSPSSPVAFSLDLQKSGSSDQKPGGGEQQTIDSIQSSQPSGLAANPSSGNEGSSPSDTGSSQSGPEGNKAADLKAGSASSIKQDASPTEIPAATASPAQGLAGAPTFSGLGSGLQRGSGKTVADARPVAPTDTPEAPAPTPARQFDLTVPNDAGHQVDIRISQRGDDVQITVRTPDGDLAQSLRHNLPELSATLSRNGLREEALSTAQSHSAGDGDRGENSQNDGGRQARQDSEDRDPPKAHRSRNQPAGSFAELIQNE
jgi:hypothetical protein